MRTYTYEGLNWMKLDKTGRTIIDNNGARHKEKDSLKKPRSPIPTHNFPSPPPPSPLISIYLSLFSHNTTVIIL